MKSLFKVALIAAAALTMAACDPITTGSGPTTASTVKDKTEAVIKDAQDKAVEICGYLPTFATAASIVATFTGGSAFVDIGRAVGEAVCGAVTGPKKAGRSAGPVTVRGVVVKGKFVK